MQIFVPLEMLDGSLHFCERCSAFSLHLKEAGRVFYLRVFFCSMFLTRCWMYGAFLLGKIGVRRKYFVKKWGEGRYLKLLCYFG